MFEHQLCELWFPCPCTTLNTNDSNGSDKKKFNTCIISGPFWVTVKTINELLMPTLEGLTLDNYNSNYQFCGPFQV